MIKPTLEDFPEFYRRYIEEVIDEDIIGYLSTQQNTAINFFMEIGEKKSLHRYAFDKWSIKEILGHICDAERLFIARALQFSRGEKQELPGFDENQYVEAANFDTLSLTTLVKDFELLRESNIQLFKTFDEDFWKRKGIANKTEYTVGSILFIVAGHLDHHVRVIKERYL